MVRSECCVMFVSWCERRSRVVEAPGTPRRVGMAEVNPPGSPRKGKTEMKKNVLMVLFVLLFVPLTSRAQGLGSITGRVTDPAGASAAGAPVTATQEGTGFSRTAS